MKIREVMTKNVAFANPNSSITEVAQLMQKHNVGSIPVCNNEQVVGIVTDRDIIVRNIAHGDNPQNSIAQDVMTSNVKTVSPETEVSEASRLMSAEQIRRVPVVDNNKLVGIVAIGDVATVGNNFSAEMSKTLTEISKPSRPERM
jgi:CBS domain-containing protein